MHRVLQCKVRHGLQAVLELDLPVIAILTDGVVTRCGEIAYENWHERYIHLARNRNGRWSKGEWEELGYELKYIPHGCFGSLYPIKKEEEIERSN